MRVDSGAFGGSGGGVTLPELALVSDPYHSSQDLSAADDSGDGLIPLDVLISRFAAKATFTAGNVTCYQVDSLNFATKVTGHTWTGYKYAQSNSQTIFVPSECALWIRFPGSAGIIQCMGSSPGTRSLILQTAAPNNHGEIYVSGLWVMGDPTLAAGTADSFEFLEISSAFQAWLWDCRILGFLGVSRIIDFAGVTQLHVRNIHFSNCGVQAGATSAMIYVNGNEFGVQVEDIIFNAVSPPANVPAPATKSTAVCYGIYRDVTGNNSAAGDVWRNIQGADPMLALINIAPTSGFVGHQLLIDINPTANVSSGGGGATPAVIIDGTNGKIRGGVKVIGGETHLNGLAGPAWQFKNLDCPVNVEHHRVDQLGLTFSFDFTGTTGPITLTECTTETANVRVPVANAPQNPPIVEVYNQISSRYLKDSGSGFSVNQLLMFGAVGAGAAPLVKTATTAAVAQDILGVAQATVGANAFAPVAYLEQDGLTLINDGNAAITAGQKLAPSSTVAGDIRLEVVASNSVAVATTNFAGAGGSTGNATGL